MCGSWEEAEAVDEQIVERKRESDQRQAVIDAAYARVAAEAETEAARILRKREPIYVGYIQKWDGSIERAIISDPSDSEGSVWLSRCPQGTLDVDRCRGLASLAESLGANEAEARTALVSSVSNDLIDWDEVDLW